MAAKRVDGLEAELGQMKSDLEGKQSDLELKFDAMNKRMEGKFATLEEMMRKMIEGQSRMVTPGEKGECSELKGKDPLLPEEEREVEFLGNNGRHPLHSDRREEYGRGDHERRGANFYRGRREFEGGKEWERRRDDRGTWEEHVTWGRGGYGGDRPFGMDPRVQKLKMPVFEGVEVDDWIHRVEHYFAVNGLTEEERLIAAGLCLEGKTLSWHKYTDRREPLRSWGEFKRAIRERFKGSSPWDMSERFFALTQEGTVEEYRERFEDLVGKLEPLPEAVLEGNFMKGLKADIRAALKVMRPRDLREAMELAQLVELQRQSERSGRSYSSGGLPRMTTTILPPRVPAAGPPRGIPKENQVGAKPGGNFKRLTEGEMQEKRAKGLCFRCDKRYVP